MKSKRLLSFITVLSFIIGLSNPLLTARNTSALTTTTVTAASISKTTWKESVAPNYVKKIGKARVKGKPKKGKIKYSKLDSLGRTKRVVGNITYKLVKKSAGWRQTILESANPSGWPKRNQIISIKLYNGRSYRGYGMNRSHLIADSLGGKTIRRNLITGTRMQNVGANNGKGGMAYTERKVANWLKKHKRGSVYYSAQPVYSGKELIPRSVIVDVKSSNKKINERVIVYNAAKGYRVNYRTGILTSTNKNQKTTTTKKPAAPETQSTTTNISEASFIANANTKKFHLPGCSSVALMAEKNKRYFTNTTISQMKALGYDPCQNCLTGE